MALLTFGLTDAEREERLNSIGASDTRIICTGSDEWIEFLWKQKRGEIALDEPSPWGEKNDLAAYLGHFVEGAHREFLTACTGTAVTRADEKVTSPDYPGLHVTLDGWFSDLPPVVFRDPGYFKFSWGQRPSAPISGPVELKRRDARAFDLADQIKTYAPQCHQAMALTSSEHSTLSTLVESTIFAHVMPFDPFYWAECVTRIEDFKEAVRTGRFPSKFPKLGEPEHAAPERLIMRKVDMATHRSANMFAAWAAVLKTNTPDPAEAAKAKECKTAKEQIKKLLDGDIGIAEGFGIRVRRNAAGSLYFDILDAAPAVVAAATDTAAAIIAQTAEAEPPAPTKGRLFTPLAGKGKRGRRAA